MPDARIIHLPFTYAVQGVPARKQKLETFHVVDTILARIPSIAAEDAPIVVSADRDDFFGGAFVLRRHAGAIYGRAAFPRVLPVGGQETITSDSPKLPIEADGFAKAMQEVSEGRVKFAISNYPLAMNVSSCGYSPDHTRETLDLRSISTTDRDEAMAKATETAENAFLFIDGVLHVREREPRWAVEVRWINGINHACMKMYRAHEAGGGINIFNLGRRSDALRTQAALAARDGIPALNEDRTEVEDHDWRMDCDGRAGRGWLSRAVEVMRDRGADVLCATDDIIDGYTSLRAMARDPAVRLEEAHLALSELDALIAEDTSMHPEFHKRWTPARNALRHRVDAVGFSTPPLTTSTKEDLSSLGSLIL